MKTKMALLGCLLATLTLVAGIGLLSLSGWFISAAAFAGLTTLSALSFNYFLPSVGVRFFSLLRIVSRYAERLVTHEVTFKTLSSLRVALYSALEPLAPAHLLRHHSGELLNRMVSDVDTLDQLYIRIITPLFAALAIVALVAFYVHYFSLVLALIIAGMLLLSLIILPIVLALFGRTSGQAQLLLNAELRTHLIEAIQGMGELILLDQWQTQVKQIQQSSQALIKTQSKMACIQGFANFLLFTLSGLTLVLILYVATPLVQNHHLNGANLALLIFTVLAAFEAISPISLGSQYCSKIRLAQGRLNQLKQSKAAVTFPTHSKLLPTEYDIEFDHVCFGYLPGHSVLNDFSLKIQAGAHFTLRGPSGSGKSTTLHLLARFFDPEQGEIRIGQVPIQTLAESDLRRLISLITQRPHLFNASLKENLRLAKPNASDAELIEALHQVQLQPWFDGLNQGLDTWLGESGVQLSGGQLRRLSVARALLHNGPIWLLDEPTEGLDQDTEKSFWMALQPLMQGRTVLMVSHRHTDDFT